MFQTLADLLQSIAGGAPAGEPAIDESQRASAALLVQVALADGRITEAEERWLEDAVMARAGLGPSEARRFIAETRARVQEAGGAAESLSAFGRQLPSDQRQQIVSLMWRVALADGRIHEVEESLIERAAEILGLSAEDTARIRAGEAAT
ncbi:hypothetical protein SLNSH_21320 [Alsobacter soli]|uniref:Co-chaperone DjlA N-terminal domain-containing protein n=1 Tax=Alsobacter soli TaxID=2109933 RepID=A0A2T1HMW9_9HYPH|nr:TerB family tellurite resistance protein [Alsobacter soli]PSC02931.1 hypothetical protein SLNSH_21320 [Alsobacter soli]